MCLCLVLLSCGLESSRPLKVATNLWPGYEPLYLAQYLGAFEKKVEVIQLASATEVMRALAHGNVDAAGLTMDEAISLMAKGLDLVILLVLDHSRGGDAIVVSAGTQYGLQGLRIGVENTATGAIFLSEALAQAGLQFDDIEILTLSPDEQEAALAGKRVDAVVTFEPFKSRLLANGGRVLLDTSQAPDLISDVLVVKADVLEHHPQHIKQLIAGYQKAREYMHSHHRESEAFFSKRLQLDKDQLEVVFSGIYLPTLEDNINWFEGSPSAYEKAFRRLLDIMKARDLVQGDPEPRKPPAWVWEVSS